MLGYRGERDGRGEIIALKPTHLRVRHAHGDPRILA
jgi:hypothetical protein